MSSLPPVQVVGAGLAGSECAFQLASRGIPVELWEMRPQRSTPAHLTGGFAELVCSNSLRSDDPEHPAGVLKREMEVFDSLVIRAARAAAVPAGSALAVDRDRFSSSITRELERHPLIRVRREELCELPDGDGVLATGPLTSQAMSERLQALLGDQHLAFYDAIAPIVEAESLDETVLFRASRYGKGGGDDYLNAPFDRERYLEFWREVVAADVIEPRDFERRLFFEGCLPIEELARRGVDTLRFGPMKPVGLETPDGRRPWAVVQLRQENLARTHYNLVGFQSRMRWPEQRRVLRMIPGLERAVFVRYGQVHRNTFVCAPLHLDRLYRLKQRPALRLAGQLTGVEGYLESAATGLLVAVYLAIERQTGTSPEPLPDTTTLGALARHLTESPPERFQPANINYGLLTELEEKLPRKARRAALAARARRELEVWIERHPAALAAPTAAPSPTAALAPQHLPWID
jgi:methylenetetrahydrofolate--tRNA-(uracil-5-)-methyltransferase